MDPRIARYELGKLPELTPPRSESVSAEGGGDFSETISSALRNVEGALKTAETESTGALVGDTAPHTAMIAMTKAELAFRFLTQARNKVVEAYQEIMRMQM